MTPASDDRCDPRVERSMELIHAAVVDELAEVGYGAMTIESVAKRAGVGKATIYRHWRGKLELIESTLVAIKEDMVVPDAGTARERVTALLEWLATYLGDSRASACIPAIVSAARYDDAVARFQDRFNRERRQVLVDIISDGMAAGELPADLDPAFTCELLVGPIFYRKLMTDQPFPPADVPKLVRATLGDD